MNGTIIYEVLEISNESILLAEENLYKDLMKGFEKKDITKIIRMVQELKN
ncbi:hypothetical protein ES705_45650 [subsurface metagenome]